MEFTSYGSDEGYGEYNWFEHDYPLRSILKYSYCHVFRIGFELFLTMSNIRAAYVISVLGWLNCRH